MINAREQIKPRFEQCTITLPDGTVIRAWRMWLGEYSYGKADSKESLLQSFKLLQERLSENHQFHWGGQIQKERTAGYIKNIKRK